MNASSSKPAISLDHLVALNDEIAALVRAGIPLDRGLRTLGEDLPGQLGRFSTQLSEQIARGESLVDALADSNSHLPRIYRATVEAGVASGRLPAALESLASSLRRLAETRSSVVLTLTYPVLLFVVAWGLFALSASYVAPAIHASFQEQKLPGGQAFASLARIGASAKYWGPIVPLVVLIVALQGWLTARSTSAVHGYRSGLVFGWIPWVGRMLVLSRTAVFVEILKLLVENRVPLDSAATLAAESTGDARLIAAAAQWAAAIRRGDPGIVAELSALPPLLRWLIAGFQRNEALLPALQHAADDYQRRAQHQAEKARVMLPVFVTCTISATIVVAYTLVLLAPYFSFLRSLAR